MTPARASLAPIEVGEVLAGKYVVLSVLGAGGMGVVVAARHLILGNTVALKFVLPELAESPPVVQRFLQEARAASRITSEHMARVSDVGTLESGAPYMVMEYLEGQDLGAVLAERGPLPVTEVVDYMLQALQAVAEAHLKGIVHRDLKPSNLFLTQRLGGAPPVKVLDFGIAKALTADTDVAHDLTSTGVTMGSPVYMSPEQIKSSRDVDARADIWSIGVILYELLTQHHPFQGETQLALLAAILTEPPRPLESVGNALPEAVTSVVLACLEKSVERRLPSVASIAQRLAPFGSADARLSCSRIAEIAAQDSGPRSVPKGVAAKTADPPLLTLTTGEWERERPLRPGLERRRGALVGLAGAAIVAVGAVAALVSVSFAPSRSERPLASEAARSAVSAARDASPSAQLPVASVAPSNSVAPVGSRVRLTEPSPDASKVNLRARSPQSRVIGSPIPALPSALGPVRRKASKPGTTDDLDELIERRN
jgi:eukaryotic-like serine/threonine-protein kinase